MTGDARLGDLRFVVIDSAGLEMVEDDSLQGRMRRLTERAVDEADRAGDAAALDELSGSVGKAGSVEEAQDAVGRLGALLQPGGDLLVVEHHAGRIVLGLHRVVDADLVDEAAVAGGAGVGDDDAVVGALLGAAAGEADLEGHQSFLSVL